MNTLNTDAKSANSVNLLFLSLLVLFVGAAIPYLDPVTPRINSDLLAFAGLPILRKIAKENANIFDQTKFLNLPLLKIAIQDGETSVANQLAKRICTNFTKEMWTAVQQHLLELKDPRYTAWLNQLPAESRQCKA